MSNVKRVKKVKRALAFIALLSVSGISNAELAIIANPAYTAESIAIEDLRKIYLGQSNALKPVDQAKGSTDHLAFLASVLNMNESKFRRHWSKIIFSGKGRPPNILSSQEAILRWVAANENAIGYIDSSLLEDQSIKVLLRVE